MSKPVLLSLGAGKVQELAGTNDNDVLTWDSATSEWKAEAGGGGGSGTVTSVGLTGGTSGIVIGGTTSPITTSGTYNLDAPQRFAFDTTSPIAPTSPGQISWNATEGSLNTLMAGGNVDAVVGQQLYQRAVNADTVTLTKGMVVYVFGSSGTRASVKRATADADLSSATILGVVAESIAQNAEGFIITNGLLKDLTVLPSTTFADGDVVYLSPTTAGGLTPTKPVAPQHLVMVGYCVKASNGAAGVLLVHPQNGYELGELHDVYINTPTSGQILIYDATTGQTRWENASLTGGTGVTVTPGAGSLSVAIGQSVATSASPTFAGLTTQQITSPSGVGLTISTSGPHALQLLPGNGTALIKAGSVTVIGGGNYSGGSAGDAILDGGEGSPNGSVYIATNNAASVLIGRTGITTTINGTLALANDLAVTEGGTGASSLTQYGVLVGAGTSAVQVTGAGTTGQYLKSGNNAANPSFATIAVAEVTGAAPLASPTFTGTVTLPLSTAGYVKTTSGGVISSSATVPTSDLSGSIALNSQVSGQLPLANGGTNANLTAAAGAVAYSTASALALTAVGTSGQFLKSAGSSAPAFAGITTADVSGTFGISSGGTNNAALSVAQGTVYYGDGSKLVGLAPGTSGHFLKTNGAGANPQWASAGSATTPYDLSGEFVGTPVASAVIMRFVAARTFTFGGTAYFACATGPTSQATFTVSVNGVSKGTVNIATSATSGTGTITSTSIAAGDLITVVATTPAAIVSPYWTLPGTV